jgi:hypothetical protein
VLLGCAAAPPVAGPPGGAAAAPVVASPRFGYQLALRDAGWRPIRAAALSPTADVALEHEGGDALVLVFAERTDERRLDAFLRQSRSYARLVAGAGASWTSAETTRVPATGIRAGHAGWPAWIVEREVERWQVLRYYTLVTVADGVGYNVLCWGSARNRALPSMCRGMLAGFQVGRPGAESLDFLTLVPESKR